MKIHVLPLLTLCLTLASVSVSAQPANSNPPTRIAVIDVQKVLTESEAGKLVYAKLKKAQDERMALAQRKDAEIRKLETELATKRASLSDAKIAELERQLADKRIDMQRYAQNADREISELRDRELQVLEQKIKPTIDALAAEMKLAAVFNKFESGLIYASDRIDITDDVIRRFNGAK
jgi:outer membrane protein